MPENMYHRDLIPASELMKQLITLLIFSCIFLSCKKSTNEEEYYTLKGLVLDFDSKQPIVGAKVFQYEFCCRPEPPVDSAVSDANGMVSFNCKSEGDYKTLMPAKDNYLHPLKYMSNQILAHISRTDTIYLAKPSYLQLTVHRSNTYQPSDSIYLSVADAYDSASIGRSVVRIILRESISSTDKIFNLFSYYELPNYDKLTFHYYISRNGTLLTNQSFTVNLIQFGTQNFTLNY